MQSLCKYKDIFGKPNQGLHKYRIFNIAIIDLVFTIIVAYFISTQFKISFSKTFIILMIIAIIIHKLFGVETTINKFIFN